MRINWRERYLVIFLVLLFSILLTPSVAFGAVNLLQNSSFEDLTGSVPTGWTPRHSTTRFEATSSAAVSGSSSALVSKIPGKTGWTFVYQDVEASPSASYLLSGWVRWVDTAFSKVSLRIEWLDELEERIGSAADEVIATLKPDAFQFLELAEVAPEKTKVARVEMFTNQNETGAAQFDDLWFGLAPEPDNDADTSSVFEGTIAEVKDQKLGSQIRTHGFVTVPFGVFAEDQFYLGDEDSGIKIDFDGETPPDLELGDEIEISCTIEESHGENYINVAEDSEISIVRTGLPEPRAEFVATGEVDESYEGRLVDLAGEIAETSGATFWIDDGSGRVKIYVKDSTGIDVPDKRVGDWAKITGIVSQWDTLANGQPSFRVMPRFQRDLEIRPAAEVAPADDSSTGVILAAAGSPNVLPETGARESFRLLGGVAVCLGLALRLALLSIFMTSE